MGVFADHAPGMRAKGLAVIPLGPGRKPHVNSFNNMRYRPSEKIVGRWAEQFPDANIGVLPGLSGKGAVVFDCDTFEAADEFEDRFGKSDLRVITRRGVHLYYRKVPFRLPGNLKKFGLEVDIKAGNQIAIAPPSIHESGHIYRLGDGCDWDALHKLRSLDTEKLNEFIHGLKQQKAVAEKPAPCTEFRDPREMRDDSRKLWVNDTIFGCAKGMLEENAMALAHQLNEQLAMHPKGKLDEDELIRYARIAWADAQTKYQAWGGPRRSVVRTTTDEIERLPPDAFKLLAKLRAEHAARCKQGRTFAIQATALAKTGFMSRHRIEKARDILLIERLIQEVSPFTMTGAGRVAAQFKLV